MADGRIDLVGQGRVGTALAARARAAGRLGDVVTRDDGALSVAAVGRPVLVCTRNDDLDGVLDHVPPARRADLVFVQNGMIRPWLRGRGLTDATRGLLFFAVPARGDDLSPGPEPSPFSGPRAAEVVSALRALGVPAARLSAGAFASAELEKLVWNSAFGLLCEALDTSVGEACDHHAAVTDALCRELIRVGSAGLAIQPDGGPILERLVAYSRSIPDYRGAVKEWRWRNGWFVDQAARHGLSLAHHAALLVKAGRDPRTGASTSR